MSTIKVVLVTKDEYDMIEDFIRYYGHIFGFNNIVIVDNGSTNSEVLTVYQKYLHAGITIIQENRPFHKAAKFMTQHIRELITKCPDTEWIVCAETDEFLFWSEDADHIDAIINPQKIIDYFINVPKNVSVLKYDKFWASIVNPKKLGPNYINGKCQRPARNLVEFYEQNWDKIAFRANAFVSVHQWLHSVNVSYGSSIICKELGLLHYHNTGKRRLFEKACKVLESIGVCQNIEATFIDAPIDVINTIAAFHALQANHGHKAEYVLDVLLRTLCWCLFQHTHNGKQPTQEFVTTATHSKDPNLVVTMIKEWQESDGEGHSFDECVYVEDDTNVQFCVYSVRNTLRQLDEKLL